MNKTTNRGGKRENSGRKKITGDNVTKSRHVKLTDADFAKIKSLGGLTKVIKSVINSSV